MENYMNPNFDLIMDPQLQNNQFPSQKYEQFKSEKQCSLMIKNINQEKFDKLKHLKTSSDWTLARSINTGFMNPNSFVGCHIGDLETLYKFQEIFNGVVEDYHTNFKADQSMKHQSCMDVNQIKVKLNSELKNKIVSVRMRIARNIKNIPLNTVGNDKTRLQVKNLIIKIADKFSDDLQGQFFWLDEISQEKRQELIGKHFLFKGDDPMQAASGYHQYWPTGRGIFVSNDQKFLMWINEGDHLRIISMEQGWDIKSVFSRLQKASQLIERNIILFTQSSQAYLTHKYFGYITCCPSNFGTGMRASVHILLPKLLQIMDHQELDKLAKNNKCQVRGTRGEHSKIQDKIDISNWRRLGFGEAQLVEDMINTVNLFSQMEDQMNSKL